MKKRHKEMFKVDTAFHLDSVAFLDKKNVFYNEK